MRASALLSAAAATALLGAAAGPATAATTARDAVGVATSSATLLDLTVGGREISAGTLSLLSDALTGTPVARVVVTPLEVDGTAYGEQTVTPAETPRSVPAADSGAVVPALAGLVRVQSPGFRVAAVTDDGSPSTRAATDSLGGLEVLGLPVGLQGGVDVGTAVSQGGALGARTLELRDLALPSVADLLAALGLDLSKLPIEVLRELVTELDLVTPAITAAGQALDTALAPVRTELAAAQAEVDKQVAAVDAAQQEVTRLAAALAPLEAALLQDNQAVTAARAALDAADAELTAAQAAAGVAARQTEYDAALATYNAAPDALKPSLQPALDLAKAALDAAVAQTAGATAAVQTATTDLAGAQSAAQAAQAAVDAARAALATARAALDAANALLEQARAALGAILTGVQPQVDALLGAITAVLDGTPLVSIDSLVVQTESRVTSASEGGQSAEVVGGEVVGLKVLGTDVLADVLGTTRLDLLTLTDGVLGQVNGLLAEVTGTLSEVLSTVPQFPALKIPAPEVETLTSQVTTGITDGFGTAGTSLRALSITLPRITLPAALALPGAAQLPAFAGLPLPGGALRANAVDPAGNLLSNEVTVAVGTLAEQVRFAPGAAAPGTVTPGTGTGGTVTAGAVPGQLPRTGATAALAVVGLALLGGAAWLRRRERTTD